MTRWSPWESCCSGRRSLAMRPERARRQGLCAMRAPTVSKVFPVQPSAPFAALTDDTIRAAVDEAHRQGRPAFAHPTNPEGLLAAVRAGVDVVAHTTPQFGSWDDAVLAAIEGADVALVPTLKVWQHHLRDEPASVHARSASTSTSQLRAWRGADGTGLRHRCRQHERLRPER